MHLETVMGQCETLSDETPPLGKIRPFAREDGYGGEGGGGGLSSSLDQNPQNNAGDGTNRAKTHLTHMITIS